MKTSLYSRYIAAFFCLIVSCTKSDDLASGTQQLVTSGTWRVTLFTDSGNDETTDFTGYVFSFNNGGTLSAVKNAVTKTGSWSVNNSSGKLIIDLGPKVDANKPLGELTDDWKILSSSSSEIRLGDDNSASNEFLTFTKN